MERVTVRGEAGAQWSSLRFELAHRATRLRVKAYFNDWWIPTSPDLGLAGRGSPLAVRGCLALTGEGHAGGAACAGDWNGVHVEVSVLEGRATDATFASVLEGLAPLTPEHLTRWRETPYATAAHHARGGVRANAFGEPLVARLDWKPLASAPVALPAAWAADSVGEAHGERQYVFRHRAHLHAALWVRVRQDRGAKPLAWSTRYDVPMERAEGGAFEGDYGVPGGNRFARVAVDEALVEASARACLAPAPPRLGAVVRAFAAAAIRP